MSCMCLSGSALKIKVLLNSKVNTDVKSFKLYFQNCQNKKLKNNNRISSNRL